MPHGTPDYGVTGGASTVYQVKDLGELAARLGSPITHDRRGDVIWWDDAECGGNKWKSDLNGANASFGVSTDRARNGRYSYRIRPGDAINDDAQMAHLNAFPVLSRLGFESSVNMTGEVRNLAWSIGVFDGVDRQFFSVRWAGALSQLEVLGVLGTYLSFAPGVDLLFDATLFHTAKLVVDPLIGRYVRFVLNDTVYNLSTVSPFVTAVATSPHVAVDIFEETLAVTPTGTYIDDVILTQNEPANG